MPGLEDQKRSVLDQQEARAKTYADFECGYMTYLGGGSEGDYEALCKGVTERFAASSEEIKKAEVELFEMGGSTERLSGSVTLPDGVQILACILAAMQRACRRRDAAVVTSIFHLDLNPLV